MTASAALLTVLKSEFGFRYVGIDRAGVSGVGVHQQFGSTGCGDARFWDHGTFGPDFNTILQRASQRASIRPRLAGVSTACDDSLFRTGMHCPGWPWEH